MMIFTLLISLAWAAAPQADLCSTTPCTAAQQSIQNQFNQSATFEVARDRVARFAGSCWQKNSLASVDPNEEYFALFHFYPHPGGILQMRGVFAHGEKSNPFLTMQEKDAENYLNLTSPNYLDLNVQPDLAVFHQKSSATEMYNWYRTDGDKLFLLTRSNYKRSWDMSWCQLKAL